MNFFRTLIILACVLTSPAEARAQEPMNSSRPDGNDPAFRAQGALMERLAFALMSPEGHHYLPEILKESYRVRDQHAAAKHDEQVMIIEQFLIRPLSAIVSVNQALAECELGEFGNSVASHLASQIQVSECHEAIKVMPQLTQLSLQMQEIGGKIRDGLPQSNDRASMALELHKLARHSLLTELAIIKSNLSESLPQEPQALIKKLTGLKSSESTDDSSLLVLGMISKTQPETSQERLENKKEFFEGIRSALQEVWKAQDDSMAPARSARLLKEGLEQWARHPFEPRQTDSLFQGNRFIFQSLPVFFSKRYGLEAFGKLDPAQRAQLQDPTPLLEEDLEIIYPDLAKKQLAEKLVSTMDRKMRERGWIREGNQATASGKALKASQLENFFSEALQGVPVDDPEVPDANLESLARSRFMNRRDQFKNAVANLHFIESGLVERNPLSWNPKFKALIAANPRKLPNDAELEEMLRDYYKMSEKQLEHLHESVDEPAEFLKSAMARHPAIVARLLANHPEYAREVCAIKAEMEKDEVSSRRWDRFWTAAEVTTLGVSGVASGGWLWLGKATPWVYRLFQFGKWSGAAETARELKQGYEYWEDAQVTEQYMLSMGVGEDAELEEAWRKFRAHAWNLVLTGAVAGGDAAAAMKAIRGNKEVLKHVAKSRLNAKNWITRPLKDKANLAAQKTGLKAVGKLAKTGFGDYGRAILDEGWWRAVVKKRPPEESEKLLGLIRFYDEKADHSLFKTWNKWQAKQVKRRSALAEGREATIHPLEATIRLFESPARLVKDGYTTTEMTRWLGVGMYLWPNVIKKGILDWSAKEEVKTTENKVDQIVKENFHSDPNFYGVRTDSKSDAKEKHEAAVKIYIANYYYREAIQELKGTRQILSQTENNVKLADNPKTRILFQQVHLYLSDPKLPQLERGFRKDRDYESLNAMERVQVFNDLMQNHHERIYRLNKIREWFGKGGRPDPDRFTDPAERDTYLTFTDSSVFETLWNYKSQGKISHQQFIDAMAYRAEVDCRQKDWRDLGRVPLRPGPKGYTDNEWTYEQIEKDVVLSRVRKTAGLQ